MKINTPLNSLTLCVGLLLTTGFTSANKSIPELVERSDNTPVKQAIILTKDTFPINKDKTTKIPRDNAKVPKICGLDSSHNKHRIDLDSKNEIARKYASSFGSEPILVGEIEGSDLYIIYAKEGTFYSDKKGSFIAKGTVIDFSTGENLGARATKKYAEVLSHKTERRKRFDRFVTPRSEKEEGFSLAQSTKPTLSPVDVLKSNPKIKQKLEALDAQQKALFQKLKQTKSDSTSQKETSQTPTLKTAKVNSYQKQKVATKPDSLLKMLASMPLADRTKEGIKVAKSIVPNLPDYAFSVYQPDQAAPYKGTITIATDFTCGYCQKLHKIVPQLTEQGYKVRYLPYPRANIVDLTKAEKETLNLDKHLAYIRVKELNQRGKIFASAMCAKDRPKAFDDLFSYGVVKEDVQVTKECEQLVRELKLTGELLFTNETPKAVFGDADTPMKDRKYKVGIDKEIKLTPTNYINGFM